MGTSRSDGWSPPIGYGGEPHATLVVRNTGDGPDVSWGARDDTRAREFVAKFLATRIDGLEQRELRSDATFLYVVMRRPPAAGDEAGELGPDTPIAEFGYGAPPASPDDWPSVPLEDLLQAAVGALRRDRSP